MVHARLTILAAAVALIGAGKPDKNVGSATAVAYDPVADTRQAPMPPCPAPFAKLLSDQVFNEYAVKVPTHAQRPVAPLVGSGNAHHYREVIRDEAKQGPNFAGHYTIIQIGCGAATNCPAIADAQSGRVFFPPELRSASALLVFSHIHTLNYRLNSRLLILIGLPIENSKRAGMSYYVWRSGRLRLIRYIPAFKLCGLPKSTQF